ncbi:phage repressor protein CI [Sodalis sp. dw_96]|uniref:phage repressor protein CI n=1 Tax=Sodalis sp. dw_96 TaxID=2719794 RepID=UPI001BD2F1EE|nr:phage repressor protein CI [Sodalis sp. dw_96]
MRRFDPNGGGREAIERAIQAYGLKKRAELSHLTGISNSTLGTWWNRDFYPAILLIGCALDTGVSLHWLAHGDGPMYEDAKGEVISLKYSLLNKGKLEDKGYLVIDKKFFDEGIQQPRIVGQDATKYILDDAFETVLDGKWLVEIEGQVSIRNLELIPVGKVRVSGSEIKEPFECALSDISVLAHVESILQKA